MRISRFFSSLALVAGLSFILSGAAPVAAKSGKISAPVAGEEGKIFAPVAAKSGKISAPVAGEEGKISAPVAAKAGKIPVPREVVAGDTIRILAIGNSFAVNAVEQNLHTIAEKQGVCLIIGNLYIGGCSLERHYNNSVSNSTDYSYRKIDKNGCRTVTPHFTLENGLADEKWDVITYQQRSPDSGLPDTHEPFLTDLISFVRERVPSYCQFWWYQTWAYAPGCNRKGFEAYDRDQMTMYNLIMSASCLMSESHSLNVIPCGSSIQNARGTVIGENVTRDDGYHLNKLGCYVAACTWFEAICGMDVRGNAFRPQDITEEQVIAAQKSAHEAVRNPYRISRVK